MQFFSRKKRFTVADSPSTSATTISPSFAVGCCFTRTKSRSKIPTLIMLSPWMRSINTSSAVPIRPRGKENTSSTFCSARIGSPAVTTPTSGTGIVRPHGFSPMMSIARGFVASRRIAPFSSSMERYRCTVELDFSPTADPISRTEGGYPFSTKKSLIYCKISD